MALIVEEDVSCIEFRASQGLASKLSPKMANWLSSGKATTTFFVHGVNGKLVNVSYLCFSSAQEEKNFVQSLVNSDLVCFIGMPAAPYCRMADDTLIRPADLPRLQEVLSQMPSSVTFKGCNKIVDDIDQFCSAVDQAGSLSPGAFASPQAATLLLGANVFCGLARLARGEYSKACKNVASLPKNLSSLREINDGITKLRQACGLEGGTSAPPSRGQDTGNCVPATLYVYVPNFPSATTFTVQKCGQIFKFFQQQVMGFTISGEFDPTTCQLRITSLPLTVKSLGKGNDGACWFDINGQKFAISDRQITNQLPPLPGAPFAGLTACAPDEWPIFGRCQKKAVTLTIIGGVFLIFFGLLFIRR